MPWLWRGNEKGCPSLLYLWILQEDNLMKAALLKNIGNLILSESKDLDCGNDEVLIKVKASSICSTDIKLIYYGHRDLKLPRIPGHEIAGTIVKSGKNVKAYKVGERVQIAPGVPCRKCLYCLKGAENMCNSMSIIGFHIDGGFAQYLRIPKDGLKAGIINFIPKNLSFEKACLAEPLACCINALNLGQLAEGESVAIFGAGPIGCLLMQLSRVLGASKIIVIETDKKRLEFAKKFGADCYIHSSNKEAFATIEEKTDGKGVDVLIAACSDGKIPGQAINVLAKRGRILFFSGISNQNVPIDYNLVHYRELHIIGAYGCTSEQNRKALRLIHSGAIDVKSLITERICLDDIRKGLASAKNKKGMKVVINKF